MNIPSASSMRQAAIEGQMQKVFKGIMSAAENGSFMVIEMERMDESVVNELVKQGYKVEKHVDGFSITSYTIKW